MTTADPLADALLADAPAVLADLLSGRYAPGAMALAERAPAERRNALARAIDGALLDWMLGRLAWTDDEVARSGARAYAAQFADALSILAFLPLPTCAATLREDPAPWDERFCAMRGPDDIDLLGSFDVAIAQHQRDGALIPRWQQRCDHAAWRGPHWQDDLGNALLGIRKLPAKLRPERLAATALVRFAALAIEHGSDVLAMRGTVETHAAALSVFHTLRLGAWRAKWAAALAGLGELGRHRGAVYEDWLRPAVPPAHLPAQRR